jgi:uncharacterized membrane protein
MKLVWLYLASAATLFALDFAWLSFSANRVYKAYLGTLMADQPNLPVAAAFYLVYVVGVLALAILPAIERGSVVEALWRGALLGLVAYGTYDLTNLSTLNGWAWQVSAIDLAWGTSLTTVVSAVGFYVGGWLYR